MRRLTITLAAAVVLAELVVLIAAEVRLGQSLSELGGQDPWAQVSRVVSAVIQMLPWLAGAILVWRRRLGMGVAIVVALSLLKAPSAPFAFRWVLDVIDGVAVDSGLLWVELVGGTVAWLLAIGAGVTAWRARPRTLWRTSEPGLGNVYVVVAFLAWLPSILTSTEFVMGELGTALGARSFFEFIWTDSGGVGAVVGITSALVLGGLFSVGPMLRRDAAGALLLAIATPLLVVEIQTIIEVLGEDFLVSTPGSIVGGIGLLGVVLIAIRWVAQGATEGADPPRRVEPTDRTRDDEPSETDVPSSADRRDQ